MTDFFVDSNSVGTPDGLTKTTAWLTAAAGSGSSPVAGDRFLASHQHSESGVINLAFDGTHQKPIEFWSIDYADDSFTPGASLRAGGTADITIADSSDFIDFHGFDVVAGDDLLLTGDASRVRFYDSVVGASRATAGGAIQVGDTTIMSMAEFYNCEFEYGHADGKLRLTNNGEVKVVGGFVTNTQDHFAEIDNGVDLFIAEIDGVDLSNSTDIFDVEPGGTPGTFRGKVNACELKSGYNLVNGDFEDWVEGRVDMTHSAVGTLSAASFIEEISEFAGTSITTTARWRTGGADDGQQVNAVSQEMTALANQTAKRLTATSFDLFVYLDGSGVSKNLTIHFAHNGVGSGTAGALQDDEIWPEYIGPSGNVTPTAQGEFISERLDYNTTATDHPTESGETWTGTNVGTKQSMKVTATNEIEGLVKIRVYFATGSASDVVVNVDRKIVVTDV